MPHALAGACAALFAPVAAAQFTVVPDLEPVIVAPAAGRTVGTNPPLLLPAGGSYTTSGNTAPALYADGLVGGGPRAITVTGGGVTASNLSGTGLGVVSAMNGGIIDLGTGTVVNAAGSGSAAGIIGATGLYTRYTNTGFVSTILARDLTVNASGDKPYAIYAHTASTIQLSGLTTIATASNGTQGWGLVSNDRSSLTAENVNIAMGGIAGVYGAQQMPISAYLGASTTVSGKATLDVTGLAATMLFARYTGSKVTVNNLSGTAVGTTGDAYVAWASGAGAEVAVTGTADVSVRGATGAGGLFANGGSVSFTGSSKIAVASNEGAIGLGTSEGGSVAWNNGAMTVSGGAGYAVAGISAEATDPAAVGHIAISGGQLSVSGDGVVVRGGVLDLRMASSTLANASGVMLDVGAAGGTASTLDFTADASQLGGVARLAAGHVSTLTLNNGSVWTLTGDSVLTQLALNGSTVQFTHPPAAPSRR